MQQVVNQSINSKSNCLLGVNDGVPLPDDSLAYLNCPGKPADARSELSPHWIKWVIFLYPCVLNVQIAHTNNMYLY